MRYQDFSTRLVLLSSEVGGYGLGRDEELQLKFASSVMGGAKCEGRSSSEKPSTYRRKPLEEKGLSKRTYSFSEHFAILCVLSFSSVSLTSMYRMGE